MAHKISPARIETFFRALAETGNQSIAAERARVSRVWVRYRGKADPNFAARVKATVAAATERLRAAATNEPAAKWRAQAGEELVIRGGNGHLVQIRRARLGEWTPRIEARFLAALAASCNVSAASRAVGMSPGGAYYHYDRWDDFARRWDAALQEGYLRLEMALVEHAGRVFDPVDYPPDVPMPPMNYDQALSLLRFHQHRVHGTGKPRDRWHKPRRSADEVFADLNAKLDRVAAMEQRRAAADPAADARAVADGMRIVRDSRRT